MTRRTASAYPFRLLERKANRNFYSRRSGDAKKCEKICRESGAALYLSFDFESFKICTFNQAETFPLKSATITKEEVTTGANRKIYSPQRQLLVIRKSLARPAQSAAVNSKRVRKTRQNLASLDFFIPSYTYYLLRSWPYRVLRT